MADNASAEDMNSRLSIPRSVTFTDIIAIFPSATLTITVLVYRSAPENGPSNRGWTRVRVSARRRRGHSQSRVRLQVERRGATPLRKVRLQGGGRHGKL